MVSWGDAVAAAEPPRMREVDEDQEATGEEAERLDASKGTKVAWGGRADSETPPGTPRPRIG